MVVKALRFFCLAGRPKKPPAIDNSGGGQRVASDGNICRLQLQPEQQEGRQPGDSSAAATLGLKIVLENKEDVESTASNLLSKHNIPVDQPPCSSVPRLRDAKIAPVLEVDDGGDHKGKKPIAANDIDEKDAVGAEGGNFSRDVTSVCDFCFEAKAPSLFFPGPMEGCEHSLCLDCFSRYAAEADADGSGGLPCPVPNCYSGSLMLLGPDGAETREGVALLHDDDGQGEGSYPLLSSPSAEIYCGICMERKPASEGFLDTHGCAHVFCRDCIAHYIAARVEDSAAFRIPCPEPSCSPAGFLLPEDCRPILTDEVFDRWGAALCESSLSGEGGLYCPYNDCSALLLPPAPEVPGGRDAAAGSVTEAQCPHCRRFLCAQCRAPWHQGITCTEFEESGRDATEAAALKGLKKLAADQRWQRCPECRFYVERVDGCVFIRCRCNHCFCYLCASPMNQNDKTHYCSNCKCTWDAVKRK